MIDLRKIRDAAIVGFSLAFIFLVIEILLANPFASMDTGLQDWLERRGLEDNSQIILIDLDAQSVKQLGDKTDLPGIWMPRVLESLKEAKAVGICLPVYNTGSFPSDIPAKIQANKLDSLSAWFRMNPERTGAILDSAFSGVRLDSALTSVMKKNLNVYLGFQMLDVPVSADFLRFELPIDRTPDDLRRNTSIVDMPDFFAPPDNVVLASVGVGFLNVNYADDGLVREIPLVAICKERFYPSLGLRLLLDLESIDIIDLPHSLTLKMGGEQIRLGEGYSHRLHYKSGLDNFTRISVSRILNTEEVSDTLFKDKIVLIGSTVEPYALYSSTPIGRIPLMVIQANLLDNLMKREQAIPVHPVVSFIVMFLFAGLGSFAVMLPWRKISLPVYAGLLALFYVIVMVSANTGTRINFFSPVFVSILSLITGFVVYFFTEGRRRTYIQQMVRQYFPAEQEKEYIDRFMDLPYLRLNKESTAVSVYLYFEKKEKSLQEALKSFEEFRDKMQEIVRENGGLRMSFMGNSALFLFSGKEGYTQACKASLDIRRFFTNFNAKYVAEGVGEFTLGIGLAGGETLVSTLGKVPLVDLAIFGDPVLLARELALLNFELKTKILLEGDLIKHLPADSKIKELGELEIVGEKHVIYEYLR